MGYTVRILSHRTYYLHMDIAGPVPSPATLTVTDTTPTLSWKIGQRLNAVVTALNGQGKISLKVAGIEVEARSSLATAVGQRLQLEVMRSDTQIVLRVISPLREPDSLATALRETLPLQQPLQTLFSQLSALLASPSGLSPSATELLKALIDQLPTRQSITRSGSVKQALMDSGQFLEHRLGLDPKPGSLSGDLKANLLKLLTEVSRGNGESDRVLARNAEAGLARIQLNQLATLTTPQTPISAWSGELPIRHDNGIDVFQWHIAKDGKNSPDPKQHTWNTWLSFNLSSLGPVYVKLSLTRSVVSATLWAELESTVELINHHLATLHQSLDTSGLEIKSLQCLRGTPPLPATNHLPSGLLDLTV
jgi:hypothetical protein